SAASLNDEYKFHFRAKTKTYPQLFYVKSEGGMRGIFGPREASGLPGECCRYDSRFHLRSQQEDRKGSSNLMETSTQNGKHREENPSDLNRDIALMVKEIIKVGPKVPEIARR